MSTTVFCVVSACGGSTPPRGTVAHFRGEDGTAHSMQLRGMGTFLDMSGVMIASDQTVLTPLSFQHFVTQALRVLRDERLADIPDCSGALPETVGDDPIPLSMFGGMTVTQEGFEIDVVYDGACEGEVPPADPGNVDPTPEQYYSGNMIFCEAETSGSSLACQYAEGFSGAVDPRLVYPDPLNDYPSAFTVRAERECEGEVCHLLELRIDPIDPAEETVTVAVSCEEAPALCPFDLEAFDPTRMYLDDDDEDETGGSSGAGEESESDTDAENESGGSTSGGGGSSTGGSSSSQTPSNKWTHYPSGGQVRSCPDQDDCDYETITIIPGKKPWEERGIAEGMVADRNEEDTGKPTSAGEQDEKEVHCEPRNEGAIVQWDCD